MKIKTRKNRRSTTALVSPSHPTLTDTLTTPVDAADELLKLLWQTECCPPYAGFTRAVVEHSPLTALLCERGHAQHSPGHGGGIMLSRNGQQRAAVLCCPT